MLDRMTESTMIDTDVQVRETSIERPEHPLSVTRTELDQMVRERAHELYLERAEHGKTGDSRDDWEFALHEIEPYVTLVN